MGTPENLRSFREGCCFEMILKIFFISTKCYPNWKLLIERSLFCRSPLAEKCLKLPSLVVWYYLDESHFDSYLYELQNKIRHKNNFGGWGCALLFCSYNCLLITCVTWDQYQILTDIWSQDKSQRIKNDLTQRKKTLLLTDDSPFGAENTRVPAYHSSSLGKEVG